MEPLNADLSSCGTRSINWRSILVPFAVAAVFMTIVASECHINLSAAHASVPMIPSLAFGAVMCLWWAGISAGMRLLAQRWPSILRFSARSFLLHGLTAGVLGVIHLNLIQQVLRIAGLYWQDWARAYSTLDYRTGGRICFEMLLYGFIFGISGFLHMQSQAQSSAIQSLKLEKQLSQAQLTALQMQMEPHFLFNTLNAVTTLVELKRNDEAAKVLAHLNSILRKTLQRSSPQKISFAQELQVIESYLAIQQVRFADRLRVKIETTPEALEGLVPCFLLQPIIENAIRHGIAHVEGDGLLETSVERIGDTLRLRVRDNGPGLNGSVKRDAGYGIGISNTRERLAYFYPGAHEFVAVEPEGGGYEVTIKIPYERQAT